MTPWFEIAVALACWVLVALFIVQVVVWIVMMKTMKGFQNTVQELRTTYEPRVAQVMTTVTELQKSAKDLSETVAIVSTEVRAVSSAVSVSAEKISVIAADSAEEIRELIRVTSIEIKALVANTSGEVQDLVQVTSGEVRTIVTSSRSTAMNATDRVDLMVERTALRVEETGEYIQSHVLDPVREVSAIVIGIKVALETLMGFPHRKQIDQAYSEEELFI
ncbi:MAG: hypothetical protein IPF53_09415 [Blastocatellia bacterium]|nr:hypothetical protein [Blastocatellia bacterium]MBK6424835.1 hypothetical protein [Blastocatellia bacterium]